MNNPTMEHQETVDLTPTEMNTLLGLVFLGGIIMKDQAVNSLNTLAGLLQGIIL